MNITASCEIPSMYELLKEAEKGNLNLTILSQTCPSVCTLAWGTGNPDLSGIGANISYILQLILTIIFGPIFVVVYGYRRQSIKDRGYKDVTHLQDTQEYLRNLQSIFVDVSAQFSIIVAVAGAARMRQSPPLFEVTFLKSLAIVQFLALFSVSFASGVAMSKPRDKRRAAVLCVYMSLLFCFYMAMLLSLQTSQVFVDLMQEMVTTCQEYNRIWPGYDHVPRKTYEWAFLAFSFLCACIFGSSIASGILRKRTSFRAGPFSLGFAIGTLVVFVQLQRTRNTMRSVTGAKFQDNQWGFGQVMAVLLWAPLFTQALYYGLVTWFPHLKPVEHSTPKPLCHQCRSCNTCVELGEIYETGQAGTVVRSASGQPESGNNTKKGSLSERFDRWRKDHHERMRKFRSTSDNQMMMAF